MRPLLQSNKTVRKETNTATETAGDGTLSFAETLSYAEWQVCYTNIAPPALRCKIKFRDETGRPVALQQRTHDPYGKKAKTSRSDGVFAHTQAFPRGEGAERM